MMRSPTMKVESVKVKSVVPRISSLGVLLDMPSCTMEVAMDDRKIRPTSCTWKAQLVG